MKILFLDDRQKRIDVAKKKYKHDDLTIVKTVKGAIYQLGKDPSWHFIHLDHDLNGEEFVDSSRKDCGMEVVRYLTEKGLVKVKKADPLIIIHSSNVHAALEMYTKLKNFGFRVIYERFRYD